MSTLSQCSEGHLHTIPLCALTSRLVMAEKSMLPFCGERRVQLGLNRDHPAQIGTVDRSHNYLKWHQKDSITHFK